MYYIVTSGAPRFNNLSMVHDSELLGIIKCMLWVGRVIKIHASSDVVKF